MNIERIAIPIVAGCLLSTAVSYAQDTTAEATAPVDPTAQSDQFREIADLLREADRVKKVLSDNEKLQKRVTDLITQNQQLTEAVESAQADNAKLAKAVENVLSQNKKLETSLEDVSEVEIQGLLLSEEKGASTAILKIAGGIQVVSEGDELVTAMGANRRVGQVVLVKEIGKKGVQLEMVKSRKTVLIR